MSNKMSLDSAEVPATGKTDVSFSRIKTETGPENGTISYRLFRQYGDESGLVEIIMEYKDGLILFLSKIVGDALTAEELTEDTFVLLGTKKPKDKGKGSFKAWLYTIGRNLAIDYLRKKARTPELLLGNIDAFDIPDNFQDISDDECLLEEKYICKERDMTIHNAMRRLKTEYRQILWLIYFEDLDHEECAHIMQKNVHAIDTLVYRARIALKKELESEGISYEDI